MPSTITGAMWSREMYLSAQDLIKSIALGFNGSFNISGLLPPIVKGSTREANSFFFGGHKLFKKKAADPMNTDRNGSVWTGERILALRRLWSEGHTTAEIGRRMGVSKNAVVGKAHRLDLPARPTPIRRPDAGYSPDPAPYRTTAGPTAGGLGSPRELSGRTDSGPDQPDRAMHARGPRHHGVPLARWRSARARVPVL